jgi:hypothetical protein
LSAHVVLKDQFLSESSQIIHTLNHQLAEQFGIQHSTIQPECENCGQGFPICSLDKSYAAEAHLHQD